MQKAMANALKKSKVLPGTIEPKINDLNPDLIIIQQQKETIIVNKSDTNEIIAFLEN